MCSTRTARIESSSRIPARAARAGRPDACTSCHVDRSRAWAIERARRWWPRLDGVQALADAGDAAGPTERGEDQSNDGSPSRALFAGDPIERALAADALGRAPLPVAGASSENPAPAAALGGRVGALLEAMAGDRYPAVRHLAARAIERLTAERLPQAAAVARAYDATAPGLARARALADLRAALAALAPSTPPKARLATLRAVARAADIDIGE